MKGQYPYQLQVLNQSDDLQDENGDFIVAPKSWSDVGLCRDEPGRRYKVPTTDVVAYISTFIIYSPKGTEAVAVGKTIRVLDGDEIRVEMKVTASRRELFHTRLWV